MKHQLLLPVGRSVQADQLGRQLGRVMRTANGASEEAGGLVLLHGDMLQKERDRSLRSFRDGTPSSPLSEPYPLRLLPLTPRFPFRLSLGWRGSCCGSPECILPVVLATDCDPTTVWLPLSRV